MTKDEAVQKLSTVGHISMSYAEDLYDSFFEKPVIPYYIADYIEEVKSEGDLTVVGAVNEAPDGEVGDWLFLEKVNTFAKAWVNGYEVEKETRYRIKMKAARYNGFPQFLCEEDRGIFWGSVFDCRKTKFTRKELEDAGFGWVFDCEGIEVKEVGDGND